LRVQNLSTHIVPKNSILQFFNHIYNILTFCYLTILTTISAIAIQLWLSSSASNLSAICPVMSSYRRFGCREGIFTHLGHGSVGIDALSSVADTQLGHLIKRLVLFNI